LTVNFDTSDEVVIVSVSDKGIGIPEDFMPRLFKEPFVRADNAWKQYSRGHGVALYLAAKLVALNGGKIWAESEIDVGTTFHFTIPVAQHD
jgi:signal transduction histidine kinase